MIWSYTCRFDTLANQLKSGLHIAGFFFPIVLTGPGQGHTHLAGWNNRGNGVLVYHLVDCVLEHNNELVERFDLALKLDATDQIDRYRNLFLA